MLRLSVALAVLLAAAAPLAAQTLFVQDTFTDSNNTQLQNHTPNIGGAWSHVIGTAPLQIQSNALTTSGNSTNDSYMNAATPPAAEYVVGVTITFARNDPNNYVELYGRGSPAATGYGVHVDAQGGWEIDRYNGGVVTVLASGTTAVVNGGGTNDVEFSIKNAVKTLVVNGTTLGTTTDNTITAAGTVGLGLDTKKNDQSIADDYFASTFAPTAVRMESISATSGHGATAIEWTTGRESENLGFRVWRSGGAEGGRRVLLTRSILAGSAFLTAHGTGNRYRWIDEHPAAGSTYWIEEIDLHGKREWHGPVVPARGLVTGKASATLATIGETGAAPHPALRHPPRANAADGTKIVVDREGWYRVPVADTHVHLVADGAEVPVSVKDGAIRFYGTPRDTTWSGTREYFVVNGASGARIRTARSVADAAPAPRSFDAVAERRDRTVFFGTLRNGDGDSFFGPIVTSDGVAQTLALHHLDSAAGTATVTIALQGGTDSPHRVLVAINGHAAPADVRVDGQQHAVADIAIPSAWLLEGDNSVTLTAANGGDDVSVIDFVRITYPHTWTADGDALVFTAPGGTRVTLDGFSGALHALDVTGTPVELQVHGNSVEIPGSGPHRVIATTRYDAPLSVTQRDPIALRVQSADIVMITAPPLRGALEPLRALRASQGNRVLVVTAEQVFDEYSFGAKDPAAIRRFLADVRPRSVLLAGEGTLDPRDYLGFGGDFVPVKLIVTSDMKTASDAWFTDFDDDGVADLPIGRIPAASAAEMKIAVDRIVAYVTAAPAGAWSRSVVTVTSDADFNAAAASVQAAVPPSMSVHAIDAGTAGATAARADLLGALNDGALLVDYLGHGSVDIWRSSSFFSGADALALANGTRAPAVIAMTCLNGYFQDVYQTSLARTLLNAPNGGAVAVWALSTLTDPRGQQPANEAIAASALAHQTLGEATVLAQRKTNDSDVRRTLMLFGDPEMKLKD